MSAWWQTWWTDLCRDLDTGCAPGAAVWLAVRGEVLLHTCHGHATLLPRPEPLGPEQWFDLASVSKAVGTTSCLLTLLGDGGLDLDQPAARWLPELAEHGRASITARHLLTHSAGFAPFVQYYRTCQTREQVRARVLATPLRRPPGTAVVYSDIGFLTLGFLLEAITGERQDTWFERRIAAPLGLGGELLYRPPDPQRCVATEQCEFRGRLIRGEVHDENAWAADGVAGHAGLFGTVAGVGRLAQAVLERRLATPAALDEAFRVRDDIAAESFWLGWKRLQYDAGDATAFGHDGFTGTLVWVSPQRQMVLALLTNRVHPTRANRRLYDFRPGWVHQAALLAGAA
ncbi:MAG: beta-lactamase family protein [Fimbriimonadaceae bacterium]|nr:beta-lactamase family protein [Fimbriimonadaceae bacterium]